MLVVVQNAGKPLNQTDEAPSALHSGRRVLPERLVFIKILRDLKIKFMSVVILSSKILARSCSI